MCERPLYRCSAKLEAGFEMVMMIECSLHDFHQVGPFGRFRTKHYRGSSGDIFHCWETRRLSGFTMSTVYVQLTTRYPNGDEHSSHSETDLIGDADQDLLAVRLRRCWAVHRLRPQCSKVGGDNVRSWLKWLTQHLP